MKEFDCSKWNNKPREMWVWDDNEGDRERRFVVYCSTGNNNKDENYPVKIVDMEFDKSKVYTALTADESLIGAKGYFADYIVTLEDCISCVDEHNFCTELKDILDYRFVNENGHHFNFFYLVEPAPEKWYVTHSSYNNELNITEKGLVGDIKFTGTKEECEKWIEEHSKPKYRPFKDCDELIKCYHDICYKKQMNPNPNNFINEWIELPTIWVLDNKNGVAHSITDYDLKMNSPNCIKIDGDWEDLEFLFKYYSFLDRSICGVEE